MLSYSVAVMLRPFRWLQPRGIAGVIPFVALVGCKPSGSTHGIDSSWLKAAPVVQGLAPTATPPTPVMESAAKTKAKAETRNNPPESAKTQKCEQICRISAPLHCRHQDECVHGCETMATGPICRTEVTRMYDCLLRQPVQNWECDENGVGAIRDTFCDKEQAAVVKCIGANADRL